MSHETKCSNTDALSTPTSSRKVVPRALLHVLYCAVVVAPSTATARSVSFSASVYLQPRACRSNWGQPRRCCSYSLSSVTTTTASVLGRWVLHAAHQPGSTEATIPATYFAAKPKSPSEKTPPTVLLHASSVLLTIDSPRRTWGSTPTQPRKLSTQVRFAFTCCPHDTRCLRDRGRGRRKRQLQLRRRG